MYVRGKLIGHTNQMNGVTYRCFNGWLCLALHGWWPGSPLPRPAQFALLSKDWSPCKLSS